MKAKPVFREIIWRLARLLVYLKRGLVFLFGFLGKGLKILGRGYKQTLGFAFYKMRFYAKRRLFPESQYQRPGWYWLGERWVLQLIAALAGIFLIWPHTRAFKPEFGEVPGRKTLLYAIAGPGEQDFSLTEDASLQSGIADQNSDSSNPENNTAQQVEIEDWSGVTISGALIKPYIVSTQTSVGNIPVTDNRLQIVQHQVKAGETLGAIASEYNLKIETILWANNLTLRALLRPGDTLKIPPADGAIHVVKKGETIGRIALLYGVNTDQIVQFNRINERSLTVGAELLIPGAVKVPASIITKPTQVTTKPTNNQATTKPIGVVPPPSAAVGTYIWPTGAKIITQYYGLRHTGVDIAGPIGLPNYAARDGVVIKSQCGYNGGYGCYIIIDHGGGITTLYGHNSKLLVSVGEQVSQGQVIGLLGSTGRSTGPHLHFEVRINGRHTNPLQYIRR